MFLPMSHPHEAKFTGEGIRKEMSLTGQRRCSTW